MREVILNRVHMSSPNFMKYVALVDDEDYDMVNQYNWQVTISKGKMYAKCRINGKSFGMHNIIMPIRGKKVIDHIDGDGLNCQKHNLRKCTKMQNTWNKGLSGKTSGYIGVHLVKIRRYTELKYKVGCIVKYTYYWRSTIMVRGIKHYLGNFKNEMDAAIARDEAAKKYFKEFARLNFPENKN